MPPEVGGHVRDLQGKESTPRRDVAQAGGIAGCAATKISRVSSIFYIALRSRPNPLIDSRTPARRSARQSEAWFD